MLYRFTLLAPKVPNELADVHLEEIYQKAIKYDLLVSIVQCRKTVPTDAPGYTWYIKICL